MERLLLPNLARRNWRLKMNKIKKNNLEEFVSDLHEKNYVKKKKKKGN